MPDRADWAKVELGYKLFPPLQRRAVGRPRVVRIRGSMEQRANRRKVKCKRCKGFGHFEKTCKLAEPTEDDDDGVDEASTVASLKRAREEDEGPSQLPKQKKKKTSGNKQPAKKKKTPIKKKLKAASAPKARVVRSLKSWLGV